MDEDRWLLVTGEEMRALDRRTIEDLAVPGELLMEVAGVLVARRAEALLPPGGGVHLVCGAGNNGGDGWVAARHLHLRGRRVRVVALTPPEALRGDAAANARRALRVGVARAEELAVAPGDVVVDAIFGTGLRRPVAGELAAWIGRLGAVRGRARVLSVDLPSGLVGDTGQVLGCAVAADETLTLAIPKLGLCFEPGRSLAGRVWVGRIGIADPVPGIDARAELWTWRAVGRRLPPRPAEGHKGRFGHLLVIAGSVGMTGAAALAARAALRAGSGLVTLACPASTNPVLENLCPEAMTVPVAEHGAHGLAREAAPRLLELASARDATVLGPGIGRSEETAALVRELAPTLPGPLLLDADGLYALGEAPGVLKARQAPTIVTPHPGEAARLLGSSAREILADRAAAARALAEASGAIAVLKGAGTVTAGPDGRVAVNPTGGPVLGTGGTGDVLAGLIGSLLGQGMDPFEAAVTGAFLHGAAGDRLAGGRGPAGSLAGEVADSLPEVLQRARRAGERPAPPRGDLVAFPGP